MIDFVIGQPQPFPRLKHTTRSGLWRQPCLINNGTESCAERQWKRRTSQLPKGLQQLLPGQATVERNGIQLREDVPEQVDVPTQLKSDRAVRVPKHPPKFFSNPLRADNGNLCSHFPGRIRRLLIQFKFKRGGKPDSPQQPQFVLLHPVLSRTDRADDSPLEVFLTADKVEHRSLDRIIKHSVDREVPTVSVLFRRTELDALRPAAIDVLPVISKGGDLNLPRRLLRPEDNDHAKTLSDSNRPAMPEHVPHLFRSSICRDVVILRDSPEQQVPHAPTRPQSRETIAAQRRDNGFGKVTLRVRVGVTLRHVVSGSSD